MMMMMKITVICLCSEQCQTASPSIRQLSINAQPQTLHVDNPC